MIPAVISEYMAKIGRKGGQKNSPAKQKALKENAKKAQKALKEKREREKKCN